MAHDHHLVRSAALYLENDQIPREDRRLAAALWLNGATVEATYSQAIGERAKEIEGLGFGSPSSIHAIFRER